jgi:hypothetical protein
MIVFEMKDMSRNLLCAHMWIMCGFLLPSDRSILPIIGLAILLILLDKFNKYAAGSARRQSNDRI